MKLIVADAYGYGVRSNSDAGAQEISPDQWTEIEELQSAYEQRTGSSLEAALRDKLTGHDLAEALALLGIV
ncbi:MAG: hypothetical protein ABI949_18200 [Ilumatobacteraceae bacterium]